MFWWKWNLKIREGSECLFDETNIEKDYHNHDLLLTIAELPDFMLPCVNTPDDKLSNTNKDFKSCYETYDSFQKVILPDNVNKFLYVRTIPTFQSNVFLTLRLTALLQLLESL